MPMSSSPKKGPSASSIKQEDNDDNQKPSTPRKKGRKVKDEDASSSPSPSKRKREGGESKASPSPSKAAPSKWSEDEDDIIRDAIVAKGEAGINWREVLIKVNATRSDHQEPRSVISLKFHWKQTLKAKMLHKSSTPS